MTESTRYSVVRNYDRTGVWFAIVDLTDHGLIDTTRSLAGARRLAEGLNRAETLANEHVDRIMRLLAKGDAS